MADLIDRRAAIDAIHEDADWLAAQGSDWQTERMERDKSILQSLPSAQPDLSGYSDKLWKAAYERGKAEAQAERKTGRWIDKNGNIVSPFWERYECSVCGARSDNYNYCPNCGAYMKGGEDD